MILFDQAEKHYAGRGKRYLRYEDAGNGGVAGDEGQKAHQKGIQRIKHDEVRLFPRGLVTFGGEEEIVRRVARCGETRFQHGEQCPRARRGGAHHAIRGDHGQPVQAQRRKRDFPIDFSHKHTKRANAPSTMQAGVSQGTVRPGTVKPRPRNIQ